MWRIAPLATISFGIAATQAFQSQTISGLPLVFGATLLLLLTSQWLGEIFSDSFFEAFCIGLVLSCGVLWLESLVLPLWLSVLINATVLFPIRKKSLPLKRNDWLFLIATLLLSIFWSQENMRSHDLVQGQQIVIHPWVDHFYHSRMIATFAFKSFGLPQNFQLAGEALQPYHYLSYMPAASVMSLTGLSSLSVMPGLLMVLGFLLLAFAAYSLARTVSEHLAPALVLLALAIPDPSFYGMGSRWTSYFFFQQIAPGACFAIAAFFLAFTFAGRSWLACGLAFLLAALFKIQIFMLYGPPLLIYLIWQKGNLKRQKKWCATALLLLTISLAIFALKHLPYTPTLTFSLSGARENIAMILQMSGEGIWQSLMPSDSYPYQRLLVGIPLVLISTYGLWLLPLLSSRGHLLLGFIPISIHVFYAFFIGANVGYGDPFELNHKTFVFPYMALALISAHRISHLLRSHIWPWCAGLVVLPFILGGNVQSAIPMAPIRMDVHIQKNIYDCASWIRTHTTRNSILQVDHPDPFLILPALADRQTYASQIVINSKVNSPVLEKRLKEVETALRADFATFWNFAKTVGINYFVLTQPAWPNEALPTVYKNESCSVIQF